MKNYNIDRDSDTDDIEQKKKKRMNAESNQKNHIESEDDLDDIDDDLDAEESDESEDSDDNKDSEDEMLVKNPMWKQTNQKSDPKSENISWKKPPSRMSTGSWFLTLLVLFIPIVNIILLIMWAFFSDSVPDEKKNFSRAAIVLSVIPILICVFGLSSFKNIAIQSKENLKQEIESSVQSELHSGMNEYNGLTDDDFKSD